jgi:hypothetical protein
MKTRGRLRGENQQLQDGHLSAWRQSGLSQSEYCRQHKLRPTTFAGWLARQQENTAWPVTLVPVPDKICRLTHSASSEPEPAGLSLVVGHRYRIEIDRQFDAGTFARLVAVLEGI